MLRRKLIQIIACIALVGGGIAIGNGAMVVAGVEKIAELTHERIGGFE